MPVPPDLPFASAELSPMARSFYGENKRVSNARLRALGWVPRYPTYREALAGLLAAGEGRR
jgi:nucleoside-diphosphate-sugar epimerase